MKLLFGDGRVLEVRDVGPVIVRLRARSDGPPIKHHGTTIVEDDVARDELKALLATGLYDRDKL